MSPKVHHPIHKCPPPVPILSQLDPVHIPNPTSWTPILILSSHLRLCLLSGLFPLGFPTKTLNTPLLSLIHFVLLRHFFLLNRAKCICGTSATNGNKNVTTVFFVSDMWRSGATDPSAPGFRTGMRAVVGFIRQLLYPQGYSHQYRSHRKMGGSHSLSGSRGKYRNLCQCRETNSSPL